MNNSKIVARNSMIGLMSQLIAVIFQFVTRSVFVRYLGVELLGVSSTFSSVLNTLSLAEMGFQSAIVYSLYKPLRTDNKDEINEIINVLKVVYRAIGILFIIAGVIFTPFLKNILKGVEVNSTIIAIFYIQVANSACSYFLAYKRSLLYADKREYLTKIIDTIVNVVVNLLKIYVVIKTSNYLIYISLTTGQTILSNLLVHVVSLKTYPYLHKTKFNRKIYSSIWGNVKNLFVGKIAYYIYTSTDSIVVSTFVGTVTVGYMVNYTTVINSLKTLSNSILNPVTPIIGAMIADNRKAESKELILKIYTFVRYVYACAIVIPMIVLMQSFIQVWVGEQYQLSFLIVILYGIDLYIHLVHSALCDFINGQGLFRQDRNIEIIGAFCNITTSIALAKAMGIAGVLIGTVLSQSIFWIGRSIIAYKYCFNRKELYSYWINILKYTIIFGTLIGLTYYIYNKLNIENFLIRFCVGGLLCEFIALMFIILFFGNSHEFKGMLELVNKIFATKGKKISTAAFYRKITIDTKKRIVLFLSIAFLVICIVFSLFMTKRLSPVDHSITGNLKIYDCKSKETVGVFANENGKYIAVIPASWDLNNIVATYSDTSYTLSIDSVQVKEEFHFTPIIGEIYSLSLEKGGAIEKNDLTFYQSNLPSCYISTSSRSMDSVNSDKDVKEDGAIRIVDVNGEVEYDGVLSWIHGRGNYTWRKAKRPYNIKLDKATPVLGLDKAQKFCMLANYLDESQIRNYIVYETAQDLGVPYAVKGAFATVYFNGEYGGVYFITDKIEISENRIDIYNLQESTEQLNPEVLSKFNKWESSVANVNGSKKGIEGALTPDNITGGYLLELDLLARKYPEETSGFISKEGQAVIIASPEYATKEEVQYISSYYQELEDALRASDGINPNTGKHYSEYIDMESFAKLYLIEEVFMNVDSGATSVYLYKDSLETDGRIYAGPVWDYDNSIGNYTSIEEINDNLSALNPNCFIASRYTMNDAQDMNCVLLHSLCNKEDFMSLVKEIYKFEMLPLIEKWINNKLTEACERLNNDIFINYLKWPSRKNSNFEIESEEIKSFLDKRLTFLNSAWVDGEEYVTVQLNTNQSTINTLYYCVKAGDAFSPPELSVSTGEINEGWYWTESGDAFQPGTVISCDCVISAKWSNSNSTADISNISRIKQLVKYYWQIIPLLLFVCFCVIAIRVYIKEIIVHKKN